MSYEFDDFEVLNLGNSKLIEAITYVKDNANNKIFTKLQNDGWINKENNTANLVTYIMELMSESNSTPLFRKTHDSNAFLTNIWLSKVQSNAKLKLITSKTRKSYEGLSKESLYTFAKLSYDVANLPILDDYLYQNHGIILTYVPNISGMKTDAVTLQLETGNPIIGMSLRHKRYDYFWFTLMHELAHIYLHLDEMTEPHLDELDNDDKNKEEIEIEANALAKELLTPRRIWSKCNARKYPNKKLLFEFSKKYEIHPAIVAGQIRFEKNDFRFFTDIIQSIDVRSELKATL